ncbi:MAG: polysaccharide export protein [Proteobacteria bacterium]|nr:polysaccharide export protein [Pseudomonadota bacterium]
MKKYFVFLLFAVFFAVSANAYNIGSGDVLHLEVYGEPELNLDLTVDATGFIEYPFVGRIDVTGRSLESVKTEIIAKLKDGYFVDPQVTVIIKQYKPFYIQGEVKSPGSYPYEVDLNVRKAIALAGGLTERASKKKIYLTKASEKTLGEIKVSMDQKVSSGDVLLIKESFF